MIITVSKFHVLLNWFLYLLAISGVCNLLVMHALQKGTWKYDIFIYGGETELKS